MKTCEFHPDGTIYKACGEPATRVAMLPHADDMRMMNICNNCLSLAVVWWEKQGIKFEL
jgi:hypothetical protein